MLIQGTKNAYTTVRENDIITYELEDPENENSPYGIGIYMEDGRLLPMCCRDKFREEFFVDHTRPPEDAEKLKRAGRLLRMISADRNSAKQCFVITEWVDSSYFVPVVSPDDLSYEEAQALRTRTKEEPQQTLSSINADNADDTNSDADIVAARLKVARLELALLEARQPTVAVAVQGAPVVKAISTPDAPFALGPYSQAIVTPPGSRLAFISGCVALDPTAQAPQPLVPGGLAPQTRRALASLKAIVLASNGALHNICKVSIFLADMDDYKEVNALYEQWWKDTSVSVMPARAVFAVANLPANALVEVDAIVAITDP